MHLILMVFKDTQTISVHTEKGEPMREKLIELLDEVHKTHLGKEYRERLGTIADYLIAHGVIVLDEKDVTLTVTRNVGEIDFDYGAEDD